MTVGKLLVLAAVILCGFGLWAAGCGEDSATETSDTSVSSTEPTSTSQGVTTTLSSISTEPVSTTDTSSTSETSATTEPADTTVPVMSDYGLWEDTIKYGNAEKSIDLNITVSVPEDLEDAGGMKLPKVNRLVGIHVKIDSVGESNVEVSPRWFSARDADGNVYESITVTGSDSEPLKAGDLKPGGTAAGYVLFEVPEEAMVMSTTCDVSRGEDPAAPRIWSD